MEEIMKKIEISKDELEMMNYNDIAYIILKENGAKMKIMDLFEEVGKLLELDPNEYQSHITDLFELLSTDKRFVMLEQGYWDLRVKHDKGMVIDDEEDDEEIPEEEDDDTNDNFSDTNDKDSDDDVEEDDLSDLVILDDNDEENM